GSIGVGREIAQSDAGLRVDIEHPVFDADAWRAIMSEFNEPARSEASQPIFPAIQDLRLQTEQGRVLGLSLDELTYTVREAEPSQWSADINSTQTAVTLTWIEKGGLLQGPLQAVFHRLAYGGEPSSEHSSELTHRVTDDVR